MAVNDEHGPSASPRWNCRRGGWERAWLGLCRRNVLARIALAFLAAVAVCVIINAWDPPLSLADGHGAHALRHRPGGVRAGRPGDDPAGAAQGPRQEPRPFHPGREAAATVAGRPPPQHYRRAHEDGIAGEDGRVMEGIPLADGKEGFRRPRPKPESRISSTSCHRLG